MKQSRRELFHLAVAAAAGFRGASLLAADPAKRNMIVRSAHPEDLEMPLDGFSSYITPLDRFFVRTHVYTPRVDLASWRLKVRGEVNTPLTLAMDELRRLPRVEMTAVLECAGNGRGNYRPPVPGAQWRYGAVGNARWTGIRLADVLKRAGVKDAARAMVFDGVDTPMGKVPDFERALPLPKALHPDTLLAYEMNGQAIPMQHGFPLRLIVPGWAGDSWCKWVKTLRLLPGDFDGFWWKTAYRKPEYPAEPGATVAASKMKPVEALKVKSVIASPADGTQVEIGKPVAVRGAAWSGDHGPVTRVGVSVDGGRSWQAARLGGEPTRYGWRLFDFTWTPAHDGYYNVMARAHSSTGETQPFVEEWNPSGYQWNVVHHVGLEAVTGTLVAGAPERVPAQTATQPPGYRGSCLVCHQEDMIQQQKLTRAQWDREINKMSGWGAEVKPDQREGILQYLVTRFGRK